MSNYPSVVQLAVNNLANDLKIAPERITVVSVEPREWSDSSLGCREPGKAYLQVITPGYQAILAANGQQYQYHTNNQDMAIRCPK